MTPDEAEALAARILAAIDAADVRPDLNDTPTVHDYCRERVASDLAGLRDCGDDLVPVDRMYAHAARYADNLRRTASLYGVTE